MVIDSCRTANCSSFSEGDHSLSYDYIHENGESHTYVWKLKSRKESSHHKSRGKKITAEMTKIELPRSYCRLNLNTGKLTQVRVLPHAFSRAFLHLVLQKNLQIYAQL